MAEVAHVGEDHGDAVFVSGGNHFVVTDRAARLNNAGDAYRGCGIDAVAEREESVRGHGGTFHFQTFITGFNSGDFRRVDAAHLTGAYADGHIIFGIHNSVGFDEFRHFPAEQRIAQFLLGWLTFADHAQFTCGDHAGSRS